MDIRRIRLVPVVTAATPTPGARDLTAARRVVVLGDSITYAGGWVEFVEAWLRLAFPDSEVEFLNLGLPSETASGMSEPGHAGGTFPRPDVHERLARVLAETQPDLILACYGMNDGIYFPFHEERFLKFQDGIIRLREAAAREGVRVIHLTPPVFDPVPLGGRTLPAGRQTYPLPYGGYNEVLDRCSEWLMSRRKAGWEVVDVHGPMNRFLAEQRARDAKFLLAGDGVHANEQGQWIIAREVLAHLGAPESLTSSETPAALLTLDPKAPEVLTLVQERQRALKDPWLTAVGHQRPGMPAGPPLADAERTAAAITTQLKALR
ncbi:MAG: SGNH/GDSL hydrolase family protein [Verrucomicrobiae bacterium]|nr:SGNH/GDSL hydrolase family protein [Verrucomicrobiae bacterium]